MLDDEPRSTINLHTARAQVLQEARLIVVDEATMGQRELYELVDVLLRDIMRAVDAELANVPFGGKVIVLSGDFRQLAPVIRHAGRGTMLLHTLKRSDLWQHFTVMKMTTNMRVERLVHDPQAATAQRIFAQWLLDIGDGKILDVAVPQHMRVEFNAPMSLINNVFPALQTQGSASCNACILTTLNKYVDDLNSLVLSFLPGPHSTYLSADCFGPEAAELEQLYPVELLNTLTPTGMPPHALVVKVGAPVVFIRNISKLEGVMNGTRGIVVHCTGLHCPPIVLCTSLTDHNGTVS